MVRYIMSQVNWQSNKKRQPKNVNYASCCGVKANLPDI